MAQEVTIGLFSASWGNLYSNPKIEVQSGIFSLSPDFVWGNIKFSFTAGLFSITDGLQTTGPGNERDVGSITLTSSLSFHSAFAGTTQNAGLLSLPGSLLLSDIDRYAWWQEKQPITSKLIYVCEITGDADGLEDITIPLSNFQYRLYDGGQGAHIEAVISDATTYEDVIRARKNGQIKIRRGQVYADGTYRLSEVARAGELKVTSNTGDRSSSVTVRGDELKEFNTTSLTKKTDKIVSRRLQANGDFSFQVEPLVGIYPGDHVWLDGSEYEVKEISVAVGRRTHQMTLVVGAV